MIMKRKKIYSLLMILGGLFTACNPDGVDSVDFDVMMENDTREVYVLFCWMVSRITLFSIPVSMETVMRTGTGRK